MSNYSVRIDLKKLPMSGVANIKGKDGKAHKCLVIDIEGARLFHSEKGAVYLDINAWENQGGQSQYGDTHYLKQSLSKSEREKVASLPEEQKKAATQILGNMRPNEERQQQSAPAVTAQAEVCGDEEQLPF